MPRYAKLVGRISVGKTLDIRLVIRADDAPVEMEARGWEAVPDYLSDDEVVELYGVRRVVCVAGARALPGLCT